MARSHHSRGRALRTGIAWDMRTGFKVKGRKLQMDGERPGVWTTHENVDQRHPQRFVRVPPPDGLNYRPGPPAPHSDGSYIGAITGTLGGNAVDLGWWQASLAEPATDSTTQQAYQVLRRNLIPSLAVAVTPSALVVNGH